MIDSFTGATERHIEVGDGLEMYIVIGKGSNAMQSLTGFRGIQEITTSVEGERVFIYRQELKKD